jgi:hypothetical protein
MAKRSNLGSPRDDWDTIDPRAVKYLMPHLNGIETFCEPCYGSGFLANELEAHGLKCVRATEIKKGTDALALVGDDLAGADAIITNPPWSREKLHPLIGHLVTLGVPVWLLFDSDWSFNRGSCEYLLHCTHIVPVGRLRWVPGTTMQGKDNVAWYRFCGSVRGAGPTLYPRSFR